MLSESENDNNTDRKGYNCISTPKETPKFALKYWVAKQRIKQNKKVNKNKTQAKKKKFPQKISTFDTPDLLLKMRKSIFVQETHDFLENSVKAK